MHNNECKVLCLSGSGMIMQNKRIDTIWTNNKNIMSINFEDYIDAWDSMSDEDEDEDEDENQDPMLLTQSKVQQFCGLLKKMLSEQNVDITENTFFDLLFHGNIANGKHVIQLTYTGSHCYTEDLVYHLNETFGAKKFNVMSCHGGEASRDLIESIYNISGHKFPAGVSISTHVEPEHLALAYLGEDSVLHSLRNIEEYFEHNPTTELPAIVRFTQDLLHDHEISCYAEITPAYHGHTKHIQYRSSNLFTIENIQNWVNSYKVSPDSFNFKSVIENYLTNEKARIIEAFKAGHLGNDSQENTDILNTLEALKDTTLTHDEYQHFVLGRLVYRAHVTPEQQVVEYAQLFADFIQLLDNQNINFLDDLNHDASDGTMPALVFFGALSAMSHKSWLAGLVLDYLVNKNKGDGIVEVTKDTKIGGDNVCEDEGYMSEGEMKGSSLYAALHPEEYNTRDEIDHANDIGIEGMVPDDGGHVD